MPIIPSRTLAVRLLGTVGFGAVAPVRGLGSSQTPYCFPQENHNAFSFCQRFGPEPAEAERCRRSPVSTILVHSRPNRGPVESRRKDDPRTVSVLRGSLHRLAES